MQTAGRAIKIIKRANRDAVKETLELSAKTENEISCEILNTITSWIEQRREANKELHRQSSLFWQETYASPLSRI